jgi:glycosyltransferase involved in cell wall biosynthesis
LEVHQVLAAAGAGDAQTNEALALRPLLQRFGRSEIFAFNSEGVGDQGVRWLEEYASLPSAASGSNLLLVHYGVGEPALRAFLESRPERLILRYHNVTPADFFEPYDPVFAARLRQARADLVALRTRVVRVLAASRYNAADIAAVGYDDVLVVPLLLRAEMFNAPAASRPIDLPGRDRGEMVTFVGRLAPNKHQALLIEAFHILKTYLRRDALLYLVGSPLHAQYAWALRKFIRELALPDAILAGHVSDEQLAAVYRRADVFACVSAHEGFGVPLIEAMAAGVPVVAWATSGVSETVDGGGLLLSRSTPTMVAEAIDMVLGDKRLRDQLVAAGRRRASDFDPRRVSEAFITSIRDLAA